MGDNNLSKEITDITNKIYISLTYTVPKLRIYY